MAQLRTSPIEFNLEPAIAAEVDGWEVVREYKDRKSGPVLIDLSHRPSWDIQNKDILSCAQPEMNIPAEMNDIIKQGNLFVSRMNQTQCQIWSLDGKMPSLEPVKTCCTEITDGQAVLALMGTHLDRVFETMTPLDMFKPGDVGMRLFQAPLFHIPCRILVLDRSEKMQVVIIACVRGYGNDMAKAILASCAPHGLTPAGEDVFSAWLGSAQ